MADSKLSGNVARTNPELCQLDDSDSDVVRQRSAVDENAAQLKNNVQNCLQKCKDITVQ